MDSLEKSKDPEYQSQVRANEKLKHDKAKMKPFLIAH